MTQSGRLIRKKTAKLALKLALRCYLGNFVRQQDTANQRNCLVTTQVVICGRRRSLPDPPNPLFRPHERWIGSGLLKIGDLHALVCSRRSYGRDFRHDHACWLHPGKCRSLCTWCAPGRLCRPAWGRCYAPSGLPVRLLVHIPVITSQRSCIPSNRSTIHNARRGSAATRASNISASPRFSGLSYLCWSGI